MQRIAKRIDEAQELTVFVVGDSITEGSRATSPDNNYIAVFAKCLAERYADCDCRVERYDGKRHPTPDAETLPLLRYDGPFTVREGNGKKITVVKSGIGGNTVRRMLNRADDFIGKAFGGRVADIYFVMAGINDALKSNPAKYVTVDVFGENLTELIGEMRKRTPDADIVFMTPTYNDKGETATSHLEPYVDKMKEVAAQNGIPVIDQHALWMAHLKPGTEGCGQGDWLAGDACHPSDIGHKAIALEMMRAIFN